MNKLPLFWKVHWSFNDHCLAKHTFHCSTLLLKKKGSIFDLFDDIWNFFLTLDFNCWNYVYFGRTYPQSLKWSLDQIHWNKKRGQSQEWIRCILNQTDLSIIFTYLICHQDVKTCTCIFKVITVVITDLISTKFHLLMSWNAAQGYMEHIKIINC